MYHYIKNGKPFVSPTPLYFFEWVYEGGTVTFGMHGTQAEYDAATQLDRMGAARVLRTRRQIATSSHDLGTLDAMAELCNLIEQARADGTLPELMEKLRAYRTQLDAPEGDPLN